MLEGSAENSTDNAFSVADMVAVPAVAVVAALSFRKE